DNKVTTYTTGGVTYYFGQISYGANGGTRSWYITSMTTDGIFWINSRNRLTDITDGTSNTFLFGERYHYDPNYSSISTLGGWAWANYSASQDYLLSTPVPINYMVPPSPSQSNTDDRACAFGSGHFGGSFFCMGDGTVRFFTLVNNGDLPMLQALSTRTGSEVVSLP
ncbi:MAG TPA: DUF1559 domain-containing protein, partial [Gemmataceae bacterium]|nr:DUF1559 domain-containing protein [Gemmataceae bacterium]